MFLHVLWVVFGSTKSIGLHRFNIHIVEIFYFTCKSDIILVNILPKKSMGFKIGLKKN